MRTSCNPCSCLTMSSKSLDQLGRWHQGGECVFVCVWVCKRNQDQRVCECVRVCVCRHFLACKLVLVSLLRAVSPEGTAGPSPTSWTPSGISPSNIGASPTPSLIMQILSFNPETQREGKHRAHRHLPKITHLIYLNFYLLSSLLLLLLMEELLQPVMGEHRGKRLNLEL